MSHQPRTQPAPAPFARSTRAPPPPPPPRRAYAPVARRVTLAMVAAPIAIVTSYVLFQRLVLGQERKKLISPPEKNEVLGP